MLWNITAINESLKEQGWSLPVRGVALSFVLVAIALVYAKAYFNKYPQQATPPSSGRSNTPQRILSNTDSQKTTTLANPLFLASTVKNRLLTPNSSGVFKNLEKPETPRTSRTDGSTPRSFSDTPRPRVNSFGQPIKIPERINTGVVNVQSMLNAFLSKRAEEMQKASNGLSPLVDGAVKLEAIAELNANSQESTPQISPRK